MNNVADVYAALGKYAQAEALDIEALDIQRRVLGREIPIRLAPFRLSHRYSKKRANMRPRRSMPAEALAGRRHALGSEDIDTMTSAADLALAYQSQGKFAESEPLAREALEFDRKKQPDDWQCFRAESLLGASLAGQKKCSDAEPLLLEGHQGMMARKDRIAVPDHYWSVAANGLSNFTVDGASRKKLPSGRKSKRAFYSACR